jgi:predicted nucleic acid-binding protein
VSSFLDTSFVVRYLTGDPPELAEKAAQIIDKEQDLLITDVVLVETAYVLSSLYQLPRNTVVDHLIAFMQKYNIAPFGLDKDIVLQALLLCRPSARVSFADALVWAAARSSHTTVVYSFDARFPKGGVEVRQT